MPTFSFPSSTVAVGAVGATTKKKAKMMAPKEDVDSHTATTATPEKNTHDTEEYAIQSEPTFPDVVILKQTDKNYIVKHNHYSLSHVKGSVAGDENPMSMSMSTNGIHSNSSTDLVSPNQIYKGQINKKRGRKPKAGILLNSTTGMYDTTEVPNIILHLKCHLSDLKSNDSISNFDYTPSINEVESYNLSTNMLKSSELSHSYHSDTNNDNGDDENVNDNDHNANNIQNNIYPQRDMNTTVIVPACLGPSSASGPAAGPSSAIPVKKNANEANIHVINERHHKEVMKKINRLKYSFHNGDTIQMKLNHKCACFWDTCEFDGPIYYTPIMIVNGVFHVSGCYCSPECALASILKEQMDTSTKFERIHLLHLLYGTSKTTGFKPAPNPNYLLDKYYGNLTIEEYRSLLKGPQLIHVVNKPLTHILPELYEDNNDFLVNSKVIPTNTLKLKKRYKTTLIQNSATAD